MARFPPLASVYTSKYAHRNVQCAKTDTKSTASGDKLVTLWVQPLHLRKLRFFFERWTIADAVLEVEPLDPLSDTLPSPVTSNVVVLAVFCCCWWFLILVLITSRTVATSRLCVCQLCADSILGGKSSPQSSEICKSRQKAEVT